MKPGSKQFLSTFGLAFTAGMLFAGAGDEFSAPVKIEAGGKPIDLGSEIGHAAPFVADFDGDGKFDLLAGEFRGRLRIYRNEGTNEKPSFGSFSYLKAGGADAKVPTG